MADTEASPKPTEELVPAEEDATKEDGLAGSGLEEEKEEKILSDMLPNRIIVARNHPLSYIDRARRILRMMDEIHISGRGTSYVL